MGLILLLLIISGEIWLAFTAIKACTAITLLKEDELNNIYMGVYFVKSMKQNSDVSKYTYYLSKVVANQNKQQ